MGNLVSGDRLWFRKAGQGSHVDIVRHPGVSGPRDHPQQGEPCCPSFSEETETRPQRMRLNDSSPSVINEASAPQEPNDATRLELTDAFCAPQLL